jgi:enoyl-CoA hydratase
MTSLTEPAVLRKDHPDQPGAVTIRFNRPHVKNALAPADLLLANSHLLDCQYDPAVKVIFLTGTGDAFCSGFDLKALNGLSAEARPHALDTATELMTRIVTSPKIIVAAINGASAGLGNHIALCSDLCIAREGAVFHFTGASKGIPSMQYGALLLPMIIGLKRAKALLLRGGRITAVQAETLGICNEVIDAAKWDDEIAAIAAEFSGRNLATMTQNKFQMNQFAFQMMGALKLSALAGGVHMADTAEFTPGRVKTGAGQ